MSAVLTHFCVNKGGKFTLKNRFTQQVVGTLYDREAYLYYFDDGDGEIGFLASDGTFKRVPADMTNLNFHNCLDYPYSQETIGSKSYYIYKIRKTSTVYRGDSTVWGTVAGGMFVATTNADMGETHRNWKQINYVKSTSGKWIPVTGAGYGHGFVDSGITTSSGYSNISFYGSW